MNLNNKIIAVNRILKQADKHVLKFQHHAKVCCVSWCSLCCVKQDIDATILEFLPGAYKLFLSGEYEGVLGNIQTKTDTMCVFYNPFNNEGCCTYYQSRGLVCRLFGFSAKKTKTGDKTLVTCKPIKQLIEYKEVQDKLRFAPEMSDYYLKLYGIDPKLTIQYLPINQAINKAIEIVSFYFQYKKKRA